MFLNMHISSVSSYLRGFLLLLISALCPVPALASEKSEGTGILIYSLELIDFVAYADKGITQQAFDQLLSDHLSAQSELKRIDDLHALTDAINRRYHDAGFTFTRAVLQAQEIQNHTLKMHIVAGVLSVVDVRGNQLYQDAAVKAIFSEFTGQLIYKPAIEEQLLLLNDFPGLSSFAYFSRGRKLGQSNLNIKIENETAFNAAVQVDNYGSDTTGENRITGQLAWNNPAGIADQLSLAVMMSEEIQGNLYGALLYKLPVYSPRWWLFFSASNNQFDVGGDFSSLEIEGDVSFYNLGIDYKWHRSRNFNQVFSASLDHKTSISDSAIFKGDFLHEETLNSISFKSTSNQLLSRWRLSHEWILDLTYGQYQSDIAEVLKDSYQIVRLQYTSSYLLAGQHSWFYSDISMQLKGQFSAAKQLPDLERFSTTGPYAVRAIGPSFYSADQAMYLSFNWRWYKPDWLGKNALSQQLRPSLFIDYAKGQQYIVDIALNRARISAMGLLLDYHWRSLDVSFSFAKTLSMAMSGLVDPAMQESQTQVYLRMAYKIN